MAGVTRQGRPEGNRALRKRLPLTDRHAQLVVGCGAVVALGFCLLVQPDPAGLGTHSRLGLPRCSYLARTGVPCPSCGATTSLCWLVRGRITRAWSTHPAGVILGCGLLMSVPFALVSALMGWQWLVHLRKLSLPAWATLCCLFFGLLLIGWPQRIERHLCARLAEQVAAQGAAAPVGRAENPGTLCVTARR